MASKIKIEDIITPETDEELNQFNLRLKATTEAVKGFDAILKNLNGRSDIEKAQQYFTILKKQGKIPICFDKELPFEAPKMDTLIGVFACKYIEILKSEQAKSKEK